MSVVLKYYKYYKHVVKLLFSYTITSLNKKKFFKKILFLTIAMTFFYATAAVL